MKYKEGQIVKIKQVRDRHNGGCNKRATKIMANCLAEISSLEVSNWCLEVTLSEIMRYPYEQFGEAGELKLSRVLLMKNDFVLATEREAFLYHIHGSKALIERK